MMLSALALATSIGAAGEADARRRHAVSRGAKSRAHRVHGYGGSNPRGTTDGRCPCNGGDVCVGPRGGRYCITSGGNKRYGV